MRAIVFFVSTTLVGVHACMAQTKQQAARISMPMLFEANSGQLARAVQFVMRERAHAFLFRPSGIALSAEPVGVAMTFVGARALGARGESLSPTVVQTALGAHWQIASKAYNANAANNCRYVTATMDMPCS